MNLCKATNEASHLVKAKTANEFNSFVQDKAADEASHLVEATTVYKFNCLIYKVIDWPQSLMSIF